jgi:WbqC-like protein family
MNALLTTAYWPNLHYFYYVFNSDVVLVEQFENYQKQSYRNRTSILTANGILNLSIPVKKNATKEFTKNIEICYKENWPVKHWRAITSAYKNSPYFDYFEEELSNFYASDFEFLLDYNLKQMQCIFKLLKVKKEIVLTSEFEKSPIDVIDVRNTIHPKVDFENDAHVSDILGKPYYQTFESKFEFQPNLSILDLILNKGLGTLEYYNF